MKTKTFILSLLMCFAMMASFAVNGQNEGIDCTLFEHEEGATTIVCEDGTVVILSKKQPNGGCADAHEDCSAIIHIQ